MAITFDEALEELHPRTIWSPEMRDLLEQLRATYAPTIEMKEYQYKFIQGSDSIVDVVGNVTVDGLLKEFFDEKFWAPLTPQQVLSAWLHPETIKVVD